MLLLLSLIVIFLLVTKIRYEILVRISKCLQTELFSLVLSVTASINIFTIISR